MGILVLSVIHSFWGEDVPDTDEFWPVKEDGGSWCLEITGLKQCKVDREHDEIPSWSNRIGY